ncbi:hypothetical protein Acor_44310 [Acrocarpospora corrugata]|uniref:Uncharacterized protein n=1 Tax=Acrocarpospora corrugata TaxID=35763 RepID=A0A5M3VZV1_9ACTN|nr:hypothetical protein [Acrocarpospora corrugata]GES02365.1 hypothetical protein Acor_44310 [Acrocarpospora corrugata]
MFFASAPIGVIGTIWAYKSLRETVSRVAGARIDWLGNATFAIWLTSLLVAFTAGNAAGLLTAVATLAQGLTQHGVQTAEATHIGQLPPVGALFAAFLGYNPIESLLAPTGTLAQLSPLNPVTVGGP